LDGKLDDEGEAYPSLGIKSWFSAYLAWGLIAILTKFPNFLCNFTHLVFLELCLSGYDGLLCRLHDVKERFLLFLLRISMQNEGTQ
jgi:hypothetical protein